MKTLLLFTTSLLLSVTTVSATDVKPKPKGNYVDASKHYRFAEPIVFMERGIEFYVFPDGSFDFDVQRNFYYGPSNSRRAAINTRYTTRGQRVQYTSDRFNKNMIVKDRFGKITRIGSTPIYYDRMGDVTRIGSVDVDYSRGQKTVSKVGGLRVNYNHWGQIVHTSGYVNLFNKNQYGYFVMNHDSFYDNYYDNDYYYYKKGNDIKKLKKKTH